VNLEPKEKERKEGEKKKKKGEKKEKKKEGGKKKKKKGGKKKKKKKKRMAIYVHLGPHNVIATRWALQPRVAIRAVLNDPYNILFGESCVYEKEIVCAGHKIS
jgi:hypothetical protein